MARWRSSGSMVVLQNKLSELFREFTKCECSDANEEIRRNLIIAKAYREIVWWNI